MPSSCSDFGSTVGPVILSVDDRYLNAEALVRERPTSHSVDKLEVYRKCGGYGRVGHPLAFNRMLFSDLQLSLSTLSLSLCINE